jgi:hypothetical protein
MGPKRESAVAWPSAEEERAVGDFLTLTCAKRNHSASEIVGTVAHEKGGEFCVGSGSCGTVWYGNNPAVSFRTDQLFKIVPVDGDDKPSLLDGEVIDLLVRDAGFLVVVSDMLDIKMLI